MRTNVDDGYHDVAEHMVQLAQQQKGFLGIESVRDGLGITVSYWDSLEAIQTWKKQTDHAAAQRKGIDWYTHYRVRVCKVEREYGYGDWG